MGLLENKVALVTGCGQGIGKMIMTRFVEEGATVYANDCCEEQLLIVVEEVRTKYEAKVVPVVFDVCNTDEIKKCIQQIKKEEGHLEVLVNNAGIMKDAFLGMIDEVTMRRTFDVNVFGLINLTQYATKLMKRQKSGSIINLSSIVGLRGNVGQTVYSATKGAVATLTKTWARELAPEGIRVNGLAPGKIDTNMFQSIGEERMKEQLGEVAMGRLGEPVEVANVAVFLASELSSYVTGEIIGVNGGWFL